MYIASLSRENFVNWLGKKFQPRPAALSGHMKLPSTDKDGVLLVWEERPDDSEIQQPIVAVDVKQLPEFFAFTSTYVSTFSPFTAYFRVIPTQTLQWTLSTFSNGRDVYQAPEQLIGITIAEAYAQTRIPPKNPSAISVQACLGTIASAAIEGLINHYDPPSIGGTVEAWYRAREFITSDRMKLAPIEVENFWLAVAAGWWRSRDYRSAGEVTNQLAGFVDRLFKVKTIDRTLWDEAAAEFPHLRAVPEQMYGPREGRIKWFDECAYTILSSEDKDSQIRGFLAGALMAFVAEGSFDYLSLGRVFDDRLPQAFLWFGLIASMHPDSDVLTTGGCLGRRVARELGEFRGLFTSPTADVAIDELAVLAGPYLTNGRFRTAHQSILSVEIAPCVNGRYGLPRNARSERGVSGGELLPEQLKELRFHLDRASRVLASAEERDDPDLFETRPKRNRSPGRK